MLERDPMQEGLEIGREIYRSSPEYKEKQRLEEKVKMQEYIDAGATAAGAYGGYKGLVDFYSKADPVKAKALIAAEAEVQNKILSNKKLELENDDLKAAHLKDSLGLVAGFAAKLSMVEDPNKRKELYEGNIGTLNQATNLQFPTKWSTDAEGYLNMTGSMSLSPKDQAETEYAAHSDFGKEIQDARRLPEGPAKKLAMERLSGKTQILDAALRKDNFGFKTAVERETKKVEDSILQIGKTLPLLNNYKDATAWQTSTASTTLNRDAGNVGALSEGDVQRMLQQKMPQRLVNYIQDLTGGNKPIISEAVFNDMKKYSNELNAFFKNKLVQKLEVHARSAKVAGLDLEIALPQYVDLKFNDYKNTQEYKNILNKVFPQGVDKVPQQKLLEVEAGLRKSYVNKRLLPTL